MFSSIHCHWHEDERTNIVHTEFFFLSSIDRTTLILRDMIAHTRLRIQTHSHKYIYIDKTQTPSIYNTKHNLYVSNCAPVVVLETPIFLSLRTRKSYFTSTLNGGLRTFSYTYIHVTHIHIYTRRYNKLARGKHLRSKKYVGRERVCVRERGEDREKTSDIGWIR